MLKVAVVGFGWWGRIIVGLLRGHAGLRVLAGVDPNTAASADFAREQGIALQPQLADALADPQIAAVVLCTPHSQHRRRSSPPRTRRQARVLREAACAVARRRARGGRRVQREPRRTRGRPRAPLRAADPEMLSHAAAGEIGTPLQVEANFSQDKFLGIDPQNWRLSPQRGACRPAHRDRDPPARPVGRRVRRGRDRFASVRQLGSPLVNGDTLAVLLSFRGGGHALISAMLATPFVGRFALYGSKGWIEVRDKTHPEAPEGWEFIICRRGGRPERREFPPAPSVLANLEAFAEAARGGAPYPVPQSEMIANICALEAVIRSTRSGKVEAVEAVDG